MNNICQKAFDLLETHVIIKLVMLDGGQIQHDLQSS